MKAKNLLKLGLALTAILIIGGCSQKQVNLDETGKQIDQTITTIDQKFQPVNPENYNPGQLNDLVIQQDGQKQSVVSPH